jgi:hypothetical protein
MRPGLVRRAHRAERLTPSPIILPAEAMAVTLLILVVALGLTIRSGMTSAAHNDRTHAGLRVERSVTAGRSRLCELSVPVQRGMVQRWPRNIGKP